MDDEGIIQIGQRKIRESQNKLVLFSWEAYLLVNLWAKLSFILSDMPCKFSRSLFS